MRSRKNLLRKGFLLFLLGAAFFQNGHVFLHLFFTQRIDEDQQQKNNQITNGRGGGADVVNTVQSFLALLNSRLTGGHTDVTYSSQSKTADATCQRLTGFAAEGIDGVYGTVITAASANFLIVNDVGKVWSLTTARSRKTRSSFTRHTGPQSPWCMCAVPALWTVRRASAT